MTEMRIIIFIVQQVLMTTIILFRKNKLLTLEPPWWWPWRSFSFGQLGASGKTPRFRGWASIWCSHKGRLVEPQRATSWLSCWTVDPVESWIHDRMAWLWTWATSVVEGVVTEHKTDTSTNEHAKSVNYKSGWIQVSITCSEPSETVSK